MFTGLIEEIGKVKRITTIPGGLRISFEAEKILDDLAVDHSVAVNGVCLTAVDVSRNEFIAEAVGETIRKSTISGLRTGNSVNLERAMRFGDRLGGHLVQGHVNGTGRITQFLQRGENWYLETEIPEALIRYVIPEGSIALDGISLTVADLEKTKIGVSVIPHTYNNTTLRFRKAGDKINIETDFLARYVENFLRAGKNQATENETFSEDWFKKMGYER
jgi:riboflavin synthase